MKALVTADLHINISNRFEDTKAVLRQICEKAIKERVDEVWILGDVYNRKRPYNSEKVLFHQFVKYLTNKDMSVIIISGNHDTDQYKVSALDEFAVLDLPNVKLLSNPVVYKTGHSDVYLGHFLIDGAKLGALDYSARNSKNIADILKIPADLYLLGDVHKPQKLNTNPDMLYVGSPERVSFGERDETKGVVIVEDSGIDRIRYTFHPLNIRPMIQYEFEGNVPDKAIIKRNVGAIIKIKITCTKEEYRKINEKEIRKQFEEAYSIKFEYNILQEERKRNSTISEGSTPLKAFAEYSKVAELDEETIKLGEAIIGKI